MLPNKKRVKRRFRMDGGSNGFGSINHTLIIIISGLQPITLNIHMHIIMYYCSVIKRIIRTLRHFRSAENDRRLLLAACSL
jgi:hypothetical protein